MKKFNILKKGIYTFCGILAAGVICMQSGFVSLAYPESGVINDSGVNIRSSADTTSTDNVMKRAEENMTVSVIGEETGTDGKTWLKITFTDGGSEKTGFVREDFVTVTETEEPEEGESAPQTPVTDKNPDGLVPIEGLDENITCYFNVDGSHYYINQGFTDDMIPDGFTRVEVNYRGNTIQVAQANEIDFYLAYLTNYDDQSQSDWCMYDAQAQAFSYWIKLETMQGKYLYLLDTFGAGEMDFGYEKKELDFDGKRVEAWQLMLDEEEDLTGENDCFYYVFGINQDGNKGLYSYYTKDGTYQRNILTGLEIVDDEYLSNEENTQLLETQLKELRDKYSDDMSKRLTIICILIVICVLLLFVTLHLFLKSRRADEDEYEDDYEEEDDFEERPRFRKRGEPIAGSDEETKTRLEKLITEELKEEPLPEIFEVSFEDLDDGTQNDVKEDDPILNVEEESDGFEYEDEEDEYEDEEDEYEDEEDEEEYVKPKRRGFFFGRPRDKYKDEDEDEYEDDEEDEDEYEDEEDEYEDEEEYVKPKRRGFFFGRRRDKYEDEDDDEYEDDEDEYEDDEDEYEDDEDEDDDEYEDDEDEYEDEEDEEEYVKPKRRGFFFGRRRDKYEDDEYEDEDEDDDYEEERMSWAQSRRAEKEAKSKEKEEAKAFKKSKAADYAERTVTAKKSFRVPEQTFDDDDDFEFEFIDLDDDF